MPIDAVIGLMLMTGFRGSSPDDPELPADLSALADAKVGGVILFDVHLPALVAGDSQRTYRNIDSPGQLAALCGFLRERLGQRLMIAVDQEGGHVARLNPRHGFPPTVSAERYARMSDPDRADAADALARMVRDAGCDVNFAPCADAVVNPDSPIIAGKGRSFGVNAATIARLAGEMIEAHARLGVVTCLKHFPGHGSAAGDTHAGFVDVTRTWRDDPELEVYRRLLGSLDRRTSCVMTAHVVHADIDPEHPASLSPAHTSGLLRGRLGFDGVVVTDSLDMGAVTRRYAPDDAAILAVNAGADILLDGFNAPGPPVEHPAPRMHRAVARALRDGRIVGGESRLRESAARILRLRRWTCPGIMTP